MNDVGHEIRRQVRAAIRIAKAAARSAGDRPHNTAVASNLGQSGRSTAVRRTSRVTVVRRTGHTHVTRHDEP